MNIAIFVFDEIQILDFCGPMDVFASKPDTFNVYTVGATLAPITTTGGLKVIPSYEFSDAPQADILIIPGGEVEDELAKSEVIRWIQASAPHATYVLSICTGAFLIAKAGLLDGLTTTTYHRAIPRLKAFSDRIDVVSDQRFVDNGKVICSAGITSGIDASFYLIQKILGLGEAQKVALYLEFDWHPERHYARADLADLALPKLDFPTEAEVNLVLNQGDRNQWHIEAEVAWDKTHLQLGTWIDEQLQLAQLSVRKAQTQANTMIFTWQKSSPNLNWQGELSITARGGSKYQYQMTQKRVASGV